MGLVVAAILMGGSLLMFLNIPGLLVVLGGTFAATSIAFPFDELKLIIPVSRRVFNDQRNELLGIAQFLVRTMQVQKREGPVALENIAEEAPSNVLKKGILLIADGTDSGTIREILATERKYMEQYHRVGQKIFNEMGKYAPAFGMVGTLIGLVQMLANMDDPASIGPAMAVALLTTFYGAVFANLIFIPMVSKLDRRIGIEVTQIQLAIVGLDSINQGDSMAIMKEKLKAFMNESQGEPDLSGKPAAESAKAA